MNDSKDKRITDLSLSQINNTSSNNFERQKSLNRLHLTVNKFNSPKKLNTLMSNIIKETNNASIIGEEDGFFDNINSYYRVNIPKKIEIKNKKSNYIINDAERIKLSKLNEQSNDTSNNINSTALNDYKLDKILNPTLKTTDSLITNIKIINNTNLDKLFLKLIEFNNISKNDPGAADLFYKIALKYISIKNYNKAIEALQLCLNINLNNNTYYKTAFVFKKIAFCYLEIKDYSNADYNLDEALKYLNQVNKKYIYTIDIADCYYKKANLQYINLNFNQAEIYYMECLKLNSEHCKRLILTNKNNLHVNKEMGNCNFKLGLILEKQKKYKRSIDFYNQALEIYKLINSGYIFNKESCLCYYNLALNYEKLKNYDQALDFYTRAADIYFKLNGEINEDVLECYLKSANVYYILDKKKLSLKKLEEIKYVLEDPYYLKDEDGNPHFEIAKLLSKLYLDFDKIQLGLVTLEIFINEIKVSIEHLEEAFNLLCKYFDKIILLNFNLSQDLINKIDSFILTFVKKLLNDPNLDATNYNNNNNNNNSSDYNDLKFNKNYEMSYINKKYSNNNANLNGPTPQITNIQSETINNLQSLNNNFPLNSINKTIDWITVLARMVAKLDCNHRAIFLYSKSIELLDKVSHDNNNQLKICDVYNNIGIEYDKLEMYEGSLKNFMMALEIRKTIFGPNHIKTAGSFNNVGIAFDKLGKTDEALDYWKLCLGIRLKSLSPIHPKIGDSYYNLGLILFKINQYSDAISSFIKAYDIYNRKENLSNCEILRADVAIGIGEIYKEQENYLNAANYLEIGYKIHMDKNGQINSCTIKASLLYGIVLSKLKKHEQVIELLEKPLKLINLENEISQLILEAYYELGLSLDAINKFGESLKYLEETLKYCIDLWDQRKINTLKEKIKQMVKIS